MLLVRALLLEAIAAVDRLVTAWLERHLGRPAAAAAGRAEHLPLAAAVTRAIHAAAGRTIGLAGLPAIRAAIRFVLESLLCVEFLLACGESELRTAIDACQ